MKPWLSRKRATAVYSVLGMDGRIELAVSKSFRTTAVYIGNNDDSHQRHKNKITGGLSAERRGERVAWKVERERVAGIAIIRLPPCSLALVV